MYKVGHILDRYVIRNMLFSYIVIFTVFVGLRIVVDLFTQIDEFTEAMLPAGEVMQNIVSYYGYHLFQYYQEFAGPMVVFAALFTLFRIRRDNETVVLLSSGISLYRLLWPVAMVGIVLNSLLIVNQELIIPRIADKLVRTHDNALGGQVVPVRLQTDRNNSLLLADLHPIAETMTEVFLITRDQQGRMTSLQHAPRAVWDKHNQRWLLEDADLVKVPSTEGVTTSDVFYKTDLSPREISLRASSEYVRFQSTSRLAQMSRQPYLRRRMAKELDLEKHFRFTSPIINVIILLLAAPLITSREPKSVFLQMVKGLLVIIGAFALSFACQQLGSQHLAPLMAAWLPVILFGPAAVLMLDSVKT
ncbi:MAG: LptF/LptG family permease [Actinobacteria bacterium]|nr:LptF/LptG family permease [Actinomycetota bacterium]